MVAHSRFPAKKKKDVLEPLLRFLIPAADVFSAEDFEKEVDPRSKRKAFEPDSVFQKTLSSKIELEIKKSEIRVSALAENTGDWKILGEIGSDYEMKLAQVWQALVHLNALGSFSDREIISYVRDEAGFLWTLISTKKSGAWKLEAQMFDSCPRRSGAMVMSAHPF